MASEDIQLMAHLMRRAGFSASYEELEQRVAKGYEATVEELLNPEDQPDLAMDVLQRYFIEWKEMNALEINQAYLTYRMINTPRPLQEKVALFWHGILCAGNSKCEHGGQIQVQLDMFRRMGMGSFPKLLLELSVDPAMVFYLDNCMSHKDAINENYGRELLELFSLGVGMDGHANYSEDDVKACARAFTGWTITNAIPRYPYGRYYAGFIYNEADHDDGEKTFLGETGNWNGEDIIEIIARQPAAARFISRHLYNFFVADETQIPSWQDSPPRDIEAIKLLEEEYFRSNYDIRSMLRVLFNSDFFKNARFAKVKSPAEAVISTLRLVGDFKSPKPGLHQIAMEIRYMGQDLMNPPTVEGWHTGQEWIDSGTLVERINFAADQLGNTSLPGVQNIVSRMAADSRAQTAEGLVDGCLDMLGAYELPEDTRRELVDHVAKDGELKPESKEFAGRVGQVLQLIVATQEYQFA
ncbi:MAG: hypothetical protein BZY75_04795 [SAR202 cluster bacterium Io17-Chloro-G7]|nr:MAG: hypothetical protein BZY75_04795 [SAR202 cluster bacterium Io17-Chloro-G7]